MVSILLFFRSQEIYRKKLTDYIAVLLAWLIMRHHLLERFPKDHRCLEPYLHQKFLVFWIPYLIQLLKIVTSPSNCSSCNSYLLIVFQNYSEVLAVLTQGFPLMRINIFKSFCYWKWVDNKPFLFFKHILEGEFFLFDRPGDFKVCESSFGLAIFSDSFSSRYCSFFCLIVLWTSFLASL